MVFANTMLVVSGTAIVEVTPLLAFIRLPLLAILNSSNVFKIRLKMCFERVVFVGTLTTKRVQ